jgi:hypothetical protein
VREVYYNIDGQGWTSQIGRTAAVTVSGDGRHTVEYYAVDKAGNEEARKSISFQIDATPPSAISGVVETHGIPNNQWQKRSLATFAWDASSDSGSGVAGYQFMYVNQTTAALVNQNFTAADPRTWSPYQFGFPSGTYLLRGRAGDRAGNWTPWRDLYVIRADNTPPTNPNTVEHLAGILSTVPQNLTRVADFRWSPAVDAGAGIDGCYIYWGSEDDGVGVDSSFTRDNRYQSAEPLCGEQERCIGYLRLKCEDQAGNLAHTWTTGFQLVYRPFLDPESKNYRLPGYAVSLGAGPTSTQSYRLHSTVGQVIDTAPIQSARYRLASGYEANRPLPSALLAQSPDQAAAAADTTCLVPRITINNDAVATRDTTVTLTICAAGAVEMRLSDDPALTNAQWEEFAGTRTWTIAAEEDLSNLPTIFAAFRYPDGTVQQTFSDAIIYDPTPPTGQVALDAGAPRTLALTAQDAGSGVIQMQISPNADFSSGTWEAYTTTVQLTPDPDRATTTRHIRFRDQAGNVSTPTSIELDTQPPTGSITIDPAELGPQQDAVNLVLTAEDQQRDALDMRISEDATFADSFWQPFTPTLTLPISPTEENWGVVYAQYRDESGNESVIYGALYGIDPHLPEITAAWLTPGDTLTHTLTVQARDLFTGVERLHLSNDPRMLEDVTTLPFTETVPWTLDERQVVWVQIEDGVGNRSRAYPATVRAVTEQRIYLPLVGR